MAFVLSLETAKSPPGNREGKFAKGQKPVFPSQLLSEKKIELSLKLDLGDSYCSLIGQRGFQDKIR